MLSHLQSGEKTQLLPAVPGERPLSVALFKGQDMEVVHFAMPVHGRLPMHKVPGEITIHCLSGSIAVRHGSKAEETVLQAAELVFLAGGEPHDVHALQDSVFLVTIVLKN